MERTRVVNAVRESANDRFIIFHFNNEYDHRSNITGAQFKISHIVNKSNVTDFNSVTNRSVMSFVPNVEADSAHNFVGMCEQIKSYLNSDPIVDTLQMARAFKMYSSQLGNIKLFSDLVRPDSDKCPHCLETMSYEITNELKVDMQQQGYNVILCRPDAVKAYSHVQDFPFRYSGTLQGSRDYYFCAWLRGAHEDPSLYRLLFRCHPLTMAAQKFGYTPTMHPKQSYDHYHVHMFCKSTRLTLISHENLNVLVSPLCYWTLCQVMEMTSIISRKIHFDNFPWFFNDTHLMRNMYLPVSNDETPYYKSAVIVLSLLYSYAVLPYSLFIRGERRLSCMYDYHLKQWKSVSRVLSAISDVADQVFECHQRFLKDGLYSFWYVPNTRKYKKMHEDSCWNEEVNLESGGTSSSLTVPPFISICGDSGIDLRIQKLYDEAFDIMCNVDKGQTEVTFGNRNRTEYNDLTMEVRPACAV